MGRVATLFYSDDSERETLHHRIMPSAKQRIEQTKRWNELAEYLVRFLETSTGAAAKTWLQGSYKFGTQIRPCKMGEEFDIDLGIYLQWTGQPGDKMTALELKSLVQMGLESFANTSRDVKSVVLPPKERCGRIIYKNDFHIDVPAYHIEPHHDIPTLATQNNGWEDSDPKGLVVWFRTHAGDDDDRAQLRRMIRYLKKWAALRFQQDSRPSSILLTVLATDAYSSLPATLADDDDVLEAVVEKCAARIRANPSVSNPVDEEENLNRMDPVSTRGFVEGLEALLAISRRAQKSSSTLEAAHIWSEAFEHFFPVPEINELSAGSTVHLPAVIQPLQVEITATPRNGNGRVFRGTNRIGPLPKNYRLEFELKPPLPVHTDVRWTVRNRGAEAERVNDLGHLGSVGTRAEERSAYSGTHYMDCVARHGPRIVGYQRIPVQISDAVARNKPRRNHTSFLSR